jgi:enoyl-CoA hydratase/carnithine racemase
MTYETIKLEHDGALATLTLNRAEKMNSLSDQLPARSLRSTAAARAWRTPLAMI